MKGKNVARDVLALTLAAVAGMVTILAVHPAAGIPLFFILAFAYGIWHAVRKECGRCGPVFVWGNPTKMEERDEEKGTIRLLEVYRCPTCWMPIHCDSHTMTIREYDEIELRKLIAGS